LIDAGPVVPNAGTGPRRPAGRPGADSPTPTIGAGASPVGWSPPRRFVATAGGYDALCLHSEQAVAFWLAMGATLVLDQRPSGPAHFEFPVALR